jgi:hypothetical protein
MAPPLFHAGSWCGVATQELVALEIDLHTLPNYQGG